MPESTTLTLANGDVVEVIVHPTIKNDPRLSGGWDTAKLLDLIDACISQAAAEQERYDSATTEWGRGYAYGLQSALSWTAKKIEEAIK